MRLNAFGKGLAVFGGLFAVALLVMGIPALITMWSMRRLTSELKPPPADLTLRATAVGCHWRYVYETPHGRIEIDPAKTPCTTDLCRFGFDSDKAMVVPVDRTVRVVATSEAKEPRDFILPALGSRLRLAPGEARDTWFRALKAGLFIGQMSPGCRADPARIGIGVRAVDAPEWTRWLAWNGGSKPLSGQ